MSSTFSLSVLRTWLSIAVVAFSGIQFSCSSGDDPAPQAPAASGEKKITSFTIAGFDTELTAQGVVITAVAGTDVSALKPTIVVSEGATVKPASGTAQDFSGAKTVRYTVTAANGTTAFYDVTVKFIYPLQTFSLVNERNTYAGVIDHGKQEISVEIDYSDVHFAELAGLKLAIDATVLKGYSITPGNGATMLQDAPVDLQIKNETSGEVVSYHLRLLNTENEFPLIRLRLPGVYYLLTGSSLAREVYPEDAQGLADTDLIIFLLPGDDVSNIVPDLRYSTRATISPAPAQAQNFNSDVTYTVTSETGVAKSYKVRVVRKDFVTANVGPGHHENLTKGSTVLIYHRCSGEITDARLVSEATGTEYTVPFEAWTDATDDGDGKRSYLRLTATAELPVETFRLHLTLKGGKVVDTRNKVKVLAE